MLKSAFKNISFAYVFTMNHGSSFLTVGFITLEDIQNSTLIMLSYFFPTLFLLCSFSDSVRTDKERKRINEVFAEL